MKPYIGITGFKTTDEVYATNELFAQRSKLGDMHTLMYGFLTSSRLLGDQQATGKRSPKVSDLAELTKAVTPGAIPMIHYFTQDPQNLVNEVSSLFDTIYDSCQAVQLNMTWPSIDAMSIIKDRFPYMAVVLCLTAKAQRDASLTELVSRTQSYEGLADYVLIDASGGKGITFNEQDTVPLLYGLQKTLPNTQIGIAGGLDEHNVAQKVSYLQEHIERPFFIDAEGRIMDGNTLNIDKVTNYVTNALEAYDV